MTTPSERPPLPSRPPAFLRRLARARPADRFLRRLDDGEIVGEWFGCTLSSAFQPIVDPASGAVLGHEAFLRILGRGCRELSPWMLFSANADDDRLVALDRLARTVHALNFDAADDGGLLFLNVHGRLLAAVADDHGAAFRRVVDAIGLPADRIVIETPLVASRQVELLAFVLSNYRRNGFQVAVNIESAAQWRRLARRVPAQFVKIDASRVLGGDGHGVGRLADDAGGTVIVVTRVESKPERWPGDVLAQGLAFGAPGRLRSGARSIAD